MTESLPVSGKILNRLHQRATREGYSVDDLLVHLLNGARTDPAYKHLDAVPSAIVVVDVTQPHQPTVYVNHAFEAETGYTAAEVIGRNLNFLQGDDRDQSGREVIRQAIRQGQTCTVVLHNYRKDGTPFWNEIRLSPLYDEQDNLTRYIGIQHDVTERVRAEEALAEHEHFTNGILRAVPNFIYVYDFIEDRNVFANDGLTTLLGYTPAELQAMGSNAIPNLVHPDDMDGLLAYLQQVKDTTDDSYFYTAIYRVKHQNGSWRWIQDQGTIFRRTPAGEVQQILGSVIDITERLEYERLTERFRIEQEQMALFKRIIAALSHDLRTPLTAISTSKDILSRYSAQLTDEKREEKLESIGRQLQYALALLEDTVQALRGNLNERHFAPVPVNLAALCRVSVQEHQTTIGRKHHVVFDNPGQIEIASMDDILVNRILMNLLSNAIKYSPEGSEVRLELDRRDAHIVFRVIDHGIGIDEAELSYIFDPLYRSDRTREVNGTGLGLSIVKDCVTRHQGTIAVESALNVGSTFTVTLPLL